MIFRFLTTAVLLTSSVGASSALAKVPYSELDILRKQTIVVRNVMDNPGVAWAKNCVPAEARRTGSGSKLALATDNAAARWKKLTLSKSDLAEIAEKVKVCEARGSCSVYEVYLGAVQIPTELSEAAVGVRSQLEKKLEGLDSVSYRKAMIDFKEACTVLKSITGSKS